RRSGRRPARSRTRRPPAPSRRRRRPAGPRRGRPGARPRRRGRRRARAAARPGRTRRTRRAARGPRARGLRRRAGGRAGGPVRVRWCAPSWSPLGRRVVRGGRYQRGPRGGWGARPIDRGPRAGVRSRRPAGEGETMSGMYGADVAELRRLGQRLAEAADRLTALRGELDALVTASPWEGPDGDELRGTWSASHGPAVAAVGAVLGEAATAVVRQADQQESASTDGAGGPGGGDGGTPGGGDRGARGDGDRPGDPALTDDLGDYEDVPPIDLENEDFSIDDINQGQVGDCWFLAGLGAVATTDPEFLREH